MDLFFYSCVGGTAVRIALVPASEKKLCRSAGSTIQLLLEAA